MLEPTHPAAFVSTNMPSLHSPPFFTSLSQLACKVPMTSSAKRVSWLSFSVLMYEAPMLRKILCPMPVICEGKLSLGNSLALAGQPEVGRLDC